MAKEIFFDEKEKRIIRSLGNVRLVRYRQNITFRGPSKPRREVPLDSPVVHSTGANSIEDYIHVEGMVKGRQKSYILMLYSERNLLQAKRFINEALGYEKYQVERGEWARQNRI